MRGGDKPAFETNCKSLLLAEKPCEGGFTETRLGLSWCLRAAPGKPSAGEDRARHEPHEPGAEPLGHLLTPWQKQLPSPGSCLPARELGAGFMPPFRGKAEKTIPSMGVCLPPPEALAAAAPAVGASPGAAPPPSRGVMREEPYAQRGLPELMPALPSGSLGERASPGHFTRLFRPHEPALERTAASAGIAKELADTEKGCGRWPGRSGAAAWHPAPCQSPAKSLRACLWAGGHHSMRLVCSDSMRLVCNHSVQ